MKQILALLNVLAIILVVSWNGYAGASGFNGNTVGGLSDQYNSLFTPAGYAFSIWGLIFLSLLALAGYIIKKVFIDKNNDDFISAIGIPLLIANIANCLWLYVWLSEMTLISVSVMLLILLSLLYIIVKEGFDIKPQEAMYRYFVIWPISLYAGWITVATVANISAYLKKIDWQMLLSESSWAIVLIIIATILNVLMVLKKRLFIFGLVGVWALFAVAIRHWEAIPSIQGAALIGSACIFISIAYSLLRKGSPLSMTSKE